MRLTPAPALPLLVLMAHMHGAGRRHGEWFGWQQPQRHPHGDHVFGGFGAFGGGFGPGHFGRGWGRGGRGKRGDVRAGILLLLQERPMHGYELIQQITERSDQLWRPSPGSVYPALSQLEDEGLVIIEKVAGRKTARLTEAGEEYVREHREELGDPWQDVRDTVGDQELDLRAPIGELLAAVAQVARGGTAEQAQQAVRVLTDARRALYRILANDDPQE